MEGKFSLVGCYVFACRPNKAHNILVSVLIVIGCKEEDGGDGCPDLDQVGVGRLAVFDLKVFSCRFKKCGKFFRRHDFMDGLLALLWMAYRRLLVACQRRSITNQLY